EGCVLHPGAWLRDAVLGDRVVVEPYSVVDGAEIGSEAKVGPFARLRPGAVIGEAGKIGNFVEIKNSRLERGVKAGHLAYLGDAEIGAGANIGAGTVTCNYDGESKHRTAIGSGAFVGSDTMLVAPVRVGEDAVTAAGSVITGDVPDGALGVGRVRQRNIDNWVERKKKGKKKL
ncbi:MAG: bifunctional UDP-N-acetylglucosamine diphosphorylase/glucosamine-1-phosphate N-acetyltransferase GlmU, partial [Acidobacteriota bacterium]|nr:bifunctional UDP-N-acetylglucosamine diphosphorylase/glucosamine-1-phosphate N-acetyltransferase GlmU [Acidobacteriota bacterium]